VLKKLDLTKIKVKVCTGPVSDELCPTLVSFLDDYKKLISFNIMKIKLIEDDIQAVVRETSRNNN